jgi:hypothetical protein
MTSAKLSAIRSALIDSNGFAHKARSATPDQTRGNRKSAAARLILNVCPETVRGRKDAPQDYPLG